MDTDELGDLDACPRCGYILTPPENFCPRCRRYAPDSKGRALREVQRRQLLGMWALLVVMLLVVVIRIICARVQQ